MDLIAFERSLEDTAPPEELSKPLQALWQEAKGAWDEAHTLAQVDKGPAGAWVHAYLHRLKATSATRAIGTGARAVRRPRKPCAASGARSPRRCFPRIRNIGIAHGGPVDGSPRAPYIPTIAAPEEYP